MVSYPNNMHIPDGYLSPQTAVTMYALSTPFLIKASKEIKKVQNIKTIPLISVFSALSFIVMMFNIPLPGGTTGHAVGAVIVSIILGPWVTMIAISVALTIQALFFGDGGILSLGVNIFNIAIVMSFTGFYLYRFLTNIFRSSKSKVICAMVSGYISLNIAAFLTAFILGIQPILYKNPSGQAIYFPYDLKTAIPAMMVGHLAIAGFAESFIAGFILSWIQKNQPQLLYSEKRKKAIKTNIRILWIGLVILILLTPLGLLATGTAWGEWGRKELSQLGLGYIPSGFDKWSSVWNAPIPDYSIAGLNPQIVYIISGIIGLFFIVLIFNLVLLIIRKRYERFSGKKSE